MAISADCGEMPHYAAFQLGLHRLPKYAFRSQNMYTNLVIKLCTTYRWLCLEVDFISVKPTPARS